MNTRTRTNCAPATVRNSLSWKVIVRAARRLGEAIFTRRGRFFPLADWGQTLTGRPRRRIAPAGPFSGLFRPVPGEMAYRTARVNVAPRPWRTHGASPGF